MSHSDVNRQDGKLKRYWYWSFIFFIAGRQVVEAWYSWGYFSRSNMEQITMALAVTITLVTIGHVIGLRSAGVGNDEDMDRKSKGTVNQSPQAPVVFALVSVTSFAILNAVSFCLFMNINPVFAFPVSLVGLVINIAIMYCALMIAFIAQTERNYQATQEVSSPDRKPP